MKRRTEASRQLNEEVLARQIETEQKAETMKMPGDRSLRESLNQSREFFLRVKSHKDTELLCYDSVHLHTLSKIATERVSQLRLNNSYTLDSFFINLKKHVGSNLNHAESWAHLAEQTSTIFSQSAQISPFLLGPMTINKGKSERVREARQREIVAEVSKPKAMSESDLQNTDINGTSKRIGIMERVLSQQKQIPFFDFIINPSSFSKSVENLFHFSFLIKEGYSSLQFNTQNIPIVESRKRPIDDDFNATQIKRHQCIVSLDEQSWRILSKKKIESQTPNYLTSDADAFGDEEGEDDDESSESEDYDVSKRKRKRISSTSQSTNKRIRTNTTTTTSSTLLTRRKS
jgi:non-structural maintenance of chromosomes element 4